MTTSRTLDDVFILDHVRTPFGRFGGALAIVRPDDLAARLLEALIGRSGLEPVDVDEVVLGDANQAGEDNRNVARMAVLLAGMPTSVAGSTVNRLCGSGLEAVIQGRRQIAVGEAGLVVAGGVESMSRAPWVVTKPEKAFPSEHSTLYSTTLGWRLVNPAMPAKWTISLGQSAEKLAGLFEISREEQDAFAARSHQLADAAWTSGAFVDEVVAVPGCGLARDESIRPSTTPQVLASLKPAFTKDGTVTAGNSSPLNDGASLLLLGNTAACNRASREPLARIVSAAASGVDPDIFGIGPVQAANLALLRAGITWADLTMVELNEAFAVQALACLRQWPDLDLGIVNQFGGSIAIGHPLGASGARVVGALAGRLRAAGGGWGLATLCIGVGQGLAVVLEA